MVISRYIHVAANGFICFYWLSNIPYFQILIININSISREGRRLTCQQILLVTQPKVMELFLTLNSSWLFLSHSKSNLTVNVVNSTFKKKGRGCPLPTASSFVQDAIIPFFYLKFFLLKYCCLENPMNGGAWWAAVHGVAKSRTRLSSFTFTFHFHALEKEMATHFSVLAWRIPGKGEPCGLPCMGSHKVGHNWSDLAAAAAELIYNVVLVSDAQCCDSVTHTYLCFSG